MKKFFSLILSLVMILAMASVTTFAEEESENSIDGETLIDRFTDYVLNIYDGHLEGTIECEIIGRYKQYIIFHGSDGTFDDNKISRLVDNYAVSSDRREYPYELGIYVYNGVEVCTLAEAIDKKYFRMSDIAHLSDRFTFACDVEKETDALNKYFADYLTSLQIEHGQTSCDIIGLHNEFILFYGRSGMSTEKYTTSRLIQNYFVQSYTAEHEYKLNIYVSRGSEICTLEEAIEKKYFKMDDVGHLSRGFFKVHEIDQETLHRYFVAYLDKNNVEYDEPHCNILGQHEKNLIFCGEHSSDIDYTVAARVIDNYVVVNVNKATPYDLGIYVYNNGKIYTLEEAVNKDLFKMSDIEHLTQHINLLYDVEYDNTLDMNDVVKIQHIAARLEQADYHYKYIINNKTNMEAAVIVQRYIAKLEDLNISEKMVVSKSYYGDISMAVVTDMQKNIAQLFSLDYDPPIYNVQNDAIEAALVIKDRYKSNFINTTNYLEDILKKVFSEFNYLDLPSYD